MQGEAETGFRLALMVAQQQRAASLELRAAISLTRLRQQQGNGAEERERLERLYAQFTEGWDTPDLQDAKALLEMD